VGRPLLDPYLLRYPAAGLAGERDELLDHGRGNEDPMELGQKIGVPEHVEEYERARVEDGRLLIRSPHG